MRKFFLSLILLLSMSFYSFSFASFIADDANRYIKANANLTRTWYIDKNSIQLKRDDPPYQIIRADIYCIDYDKNDITRSIYDFYYDNTDNTLWIKHYANMRYDKNGNKLWENPNRLPSLNLVPNDKRWSHSSIGNMVYYLYYHKYYFKTPQK